MSSFNKRDTHHLLKRVARSDQKAFEELFNLYFPWLIIRVVGIVRKKEIAEEIVEDVFFKLWQNRATLEQIDNLATYIYVAAKNKSYNYLKSSEYSHKLESFDTTEFSSVNSSPETIYLKKELKTELDYAVAALPERCRHIFELVRIKGYSYKETAEILNISSKTVENQLTIAIGKLSKLLAGYYDRNSVSKAKIVENAVIFLFSHFII